MLNVIFGSTERQTSFTFFTSTLFSLQYPEYALPSYVRFNYDYSVFGNDNDNVMHQGDV